MGIKPKEAACRKSWLGSPAGVAAGLLVVLVVA